MLTLANGVCGFASIIWASRVHPATLYNASESYQQSLQFLEYSAWLIFAGMIFDVLDGRVARMANSASKFGAELDSLCDAITFGAAPAFLMLKLGPTPDRLFLYKVLFVAATFYVICTILRLARFNVETGLDADSHRAFKGLPSPAAAGCIAAVALIRQDAYIYADVIDPARVAEFIAVALPFAGIGIASLMVSSFRYPHLVNQALRGRRQFSYLVTALVAVMLLAVLRELVLALAFWGFAGFGIVNWMLVRKAPQPKLGPSPDAPNSEADAIAKTG